MSKDKNLLLVSSGGGKNFSLASNLKDIIDSKFHLVTKLINLELYKLPLYINGIDSDNSVAKELSDEFNKADAFIFCAPEYNGGSPPILTNAITWVSLSTDNWRDGFKKELNIDSAHRTIQSLINLL